MKSYKGLLLALCLSAGILSQADAQCTKPYAAKKVHATQHKTLASHTNAGKTHCVCRQTVKTKNISAIRTSEYSGYRPFYQGDTMRMREDIRNNNDVIYDNGALLNSHYNYYDTVGTPDNGALNNGMMPPGSNNYNGNKDSLVMPQLGNRPPYIR